MIIEEDNYLAHYGILRRSGRYPWGSGRTQSARNKTFLDMTEDLKKKGFTDVQICKAFGITEKDGSVTPGFSTTQLRAARSIAKTEQKAAQIHQVETLAAKGLSNVAIGQKMGLNESSVRALRNPSAKIKSDILNTTADMLKQRVAESNFIDIGKGNEHHIGITDSMLKNAVALLKEQGYEVHSVPIDQLGTGKKTNVKVLAPPGTTWGDVKKGQNDIKLVNRWSEDGGRTTLGLHEPISLHPDRVQVKYKHDGGAQLDGVMHVRPGVKDVSIGGASYAQVRVTVNGTHYLKGMAVYKEGLPKGVDVVFHTNKDDTGNKLDALKPLKTKSKTDPTIDKDNPYGANIKRQIVELVNGKEKNTSAMNIVNEEGQWSTWSRTLSSQMLSKQNPSLAKAQLDLTFKQRQDEFKRISELTNPVVKKRLLEDFGDGSDSAAVHLKAAAIPGTHGHHVIIPIPSMKPTEVYAPNYENGARVVLIRHPHGGTFEIPELTVNNHHEEAKKILHMAKDAIGIHHSVAERLSGADFDGDTVLVIPNNGNRVKTTAALERLKNFDPKTEYRKYEGMHVMTKGNTQTQMGVISNLITDMTIKRASTAELARAVRHSMVVIDAEKHELNWKQSAKDHGIKQLQEKYQEHGASTLISRAGSKVRIPEQTPRKQAAGGPIDRATGARVFTPTGKTYPNKKGIDTPKVDKVKRLSVTNDAHALSSGTRIERIYADHSNRLKAQGNEARRISVNIPNSVYNESAAKAYKPEVTSLSAKLKLAERNAPLERQAQIIGNAVYRKKLSEDPMMDDVTKKKIRFQAMTEARNRMGAGKEKIEVTQKEWDAIQAGAVSNNKLNNILDHANMEIIREYATPRAKTVLNTSRTAQAKTMLANGFTRAEVAKQLGVSLTTLDLATNG